MLIYKIFRTEEWQALHETGHTAGAPVDLADGFIHFSTAEQAPETAAKHFAGFARLILVAVDADTLGDDLKWEVSRNDDKFPHLYRDLHLSEVLWARPMPLVGDKHRFPAGWTGEIAS